MTSTSPSFLEAHAVALADIAQLAGVGVENVFLYSDHPSKTSGRWFFQSWIDGIPGAKTVCTTMPQASANVSVVLAWCRAYPEKARALTENYRP